MTPPTFVINSQVNGPRSKIEFFMQNYDINVLEYVLLITVKLPQKCFA
jgi:hypothetical protein